MVTLFLYNLIFTQSFSNESVNVTNIVYSIFGQEIENNVIPSINNTNVTERKLEKGTLLLDNLIVPIKYEKIGNLSLFENDIILTNEIIGGKAAIDKFIKTDPWINGIIPYIIHPDTPNKENINQAITYVMDNTPIKFIPVKIVNGIIQDANFVVFVPHNSICASPIGMMNGNNLVLGNSYKGQPVFVSDWCKTGDLIHELGHTLGLWHEHTRCDRDPYIEIVWNNIQEDSKHNFEVICDPTDPSKASLSPISYGEYDYCSMMHYPERAENSINHSSPIIIPKQQVVGCEHIGQTGKLSEVDLDAIYYIYSFLG